MLTLQQIQDIIPHRSPFLWLDEVTELASDRIVARKFLPDDLEIFRGHYPHFPVLPGVIQCEAAFQAGAILIAKAEAMTAEDDKNAGKVPVVTRQNNTKFRRMVRPGETLEIEVRLKEKVAHAWFLTGSTAVDGQIATRLEFACALAPMQ